MRPHSHGRLRDSEMKGSVAAQGCKMRSPWQVAESTKIWRGRSKPCRVKPNSLVFAQMHHGRDKDSLLFHGVDQAIRKLLKEIASKPAFQDTPDSRVSLNLLEGRFNSIKEFLPKPLVTILIEFCCLADF
jgi:hypothetical protein